MEFYVMTLFPQMIQQAVSFSILDRAQKQGRIGRFSADSPSKMKNEE